MAYEVIYYDAAEKFLGELQEPLEQDEVNHGVILGVSMRMMRRANMPDEAPCLTAVHDGRAFVLAGMITPPFNLVLAAITRDLPGAALDRLCESLEMRGWELPGVLAPVKLATDFSERWAERQALGTAVSMRQRLFKLTGVEPLARRAPGRIRQALEDDFELVADWFYAFGMDAFGHAEIPRSRLIAETRIEEGDIYLWEHEGRPVSMAARSRPTRNGVCIGPVYTPPEERSRGYASECVAALSQMQLYAGYAFCTLFTDLANPTSNHIYQVIGYHPVNDFWEIRFVPRG